MREDWRDISLNFNNRGKRGEINFNFNSNSKFNANNLF